MQIRCSIGDGTWSTATESSSIDFIAGQVLAINSGGEPNLASTSNVVVSVDHSAAKHTSESFLAGVIEMVFKDRNSAVAKSVQTMTLDSKVTSLDDGKTSAFGEEVIKRLQAQDIPSLASFTKLISTDILLEGRPSQHLFTVTEHGHSMACTTVEEATSAISQTCTTALPLSAMPVCVQINFTFRLVHTLEVIDTEDDDLGIELPPQYKSVFSQHMLKVTIVPQYGSDSPFRDFVSFATIAGIAARMYKAKSPTVLVASDESRFTLMNEATVFVTADADDEEAIMLRELSNNGICAPLITRTLEWAHASRPIILSPDQAPINISLSLADSICVPPTQISAKAIESHQKELDTLRHENSTLKNQIDLLQLSLAQHKGLFTPVKNNSLAASSVLGDISIMLPSPATRSQAMIDSFVLPPPSELRARRNKEKQLYGSFVQSLYYINTQDSFNFQYPPPLHLENVASARALKGAMADSFVNAMLSSSEAEMSPLRSTKEHQATPFVDAAVFDSEGECDDDDEARARSQRRKNGKGKGLGSNGSRSPEFSPRRSVALPKFPMPDLLASFTTLVRSESTQRAQIEQHANNHFAHYILAPFVSWLKLLAFGRRVGLSDQPPDDTAQIICEMLEDHAEGMTAMMADIVDAKGEALFEAVVQAAMRTTRKDSSAVATVPSQYSSVPITLANPNTIPSSAVALTTPPSQQEVARRLETHKLLLLTGRNPEGDRLRGLGYQLPPLKVEALQEDTKQWRSTLIVSQTGGGQIIAPSISSISTITGGANSTSPSGVSTVTTAAGQHTAPYLDDFRSMCAYNFFILGESNVGKSSVVACLTTKTPKLFKKCPSVVSPTLGVTRHQHFCSLQHSATTMLPLGGMSKEADLNIQLLTRDDRVTYNIQSALGAQPWPQDSPVKPQAFTVCQPTVNGTLAVNLVEVPSSILDLGAATCLGEGLGFSGAAKSQSLAVPPESACGPWWGKRAKGTFPTKGAAYFLLYDLTEDMALSQKNMERILKNVLGTFVRINTKDTGRRTVPFVLLGTHSDLLRPEDSSSSDRASDHQNTLQTILRVQREWFHQLVAELLPDSAAYRPILLDSYAVSCKEWSVAGERPRSAVDFESLCASTVQIMSVHSPINPLHMLPSLPELSLRGIFEDILGGQSLSVFERYLRGGIESQSSFVGDSTKATSIWRGMLQATNTYATGSLERFWAECTNSGGSPVAVIYPSASVAIDNVPPSAPSEAKSSFLSFGTNKSNQLLTKEALHERQLQVDRAKRPCLPLVSTVTLSDGSCASAMAVGFSVDYAAQAQRGANQGLPVYSGLESVSGSSCTDSSPQAVLTKVAVEEVLRALKVSEAGYDTVPSGYLLTPVLTRVMDWLSYAPYGMVTLLSALKRFADVSNVLIDGLTMTFLVHQHLGLLPYSLASSRESGKGADAEGDGILSAVFRMHVDAQYQHYQLYLEQNKRRRKEAKKAGLLPVTSGDVSNVSFGMGASEAANNEEEVDPLAEELWAATMSAGGEANTSDTTAATKEEIRLKCPVLGLNNEKHWPPELISCRTIIVDHVVSDLITRGILQPLHTSPTSTCYSVGHIWKDTVLTSIASLKVLQAAALVPRASMPVRSRAVPMSLLCNKEMLGPAGVVGTLANASGFSTSSMLPTSSGGNGVGTPERLLANLFTRIREQGVVSVGNSLSGAFSSNVTYFASAGIPTAPCPWSGTHRLLTCNFPLVLDAVGPAAVDKYFKGFVTAETLRLLANGPLRWLSSTSSTQPKAPASPYITPVSRVASGLVGATSALSASDGYGTLAHSARHFLMQLNRFLTQRYPAALKVTPLPGGAESVVAALSEEPAHGAQSSATPTIEQLQSLITVSLALKSFVDLPAGSYSMPNDGTALFIPQLIDRSAPRSVLDGIGFLVGVGCEVTAKACVSIRGCGVAGVAPRVFGSLGACLHSFVSDVYREWITAQVMQWLLAESDPVVSSPTGNHSASSPADSLIMHAVELEALIRSSATKDQPILSSFKAWSNAIVCSMLGGAMWCVLANDEDALEGRAKAASKIQHTDRLVIVVGANDQDTLFKAMPKDKMLTVVSAVATAISASFVREGCGYHATNVSIEGLTNKASDVFTPVQQQLITNASSLHPCNVSAVLSAFSGDQMATYSYLLPLHIAWSEPGLRVRPIVAVRKPLLPWSVVEEQLIEMSAEISLDGRGASGAVALANTRGAGSSKLLGEIDYGLQGHDVMVAVAAVLSNASDIGAQILTTQSPLSQHLYSLPMNRVEARRKVLEELLSSVKHVVEGTKAVGLDELSLLAESCL